VFFLETASAKQAFHKSEDTCFLASCGSTS